MIAVCLPQPWAGLVLSGQLNLINARHYTTHRDEMMVYAGGVDPDAKHPYRHVTGLMDQTDAYLGFVSVQDVRDPYEVDAVAYLGLGWWWSVEPGEMMIDPVGAKQDRRWGESFMVPDEHRDHINPMRIGKTAWWDRYLDAYNASNRHSKGAHQDGKTK